MSTVVTCGETPGFWASVREAIRGTHQDFTSGSLNRAIILLAIPMVLEMVMESLFAVVDAFWVAHLGSDAMATVGITESMMTLIYAVMMGLGLSTTAMVARRIGETDSEGAAVAAVQAVVLGLAGAVVMGLPCWLYAPRLLQLMGASSSMVQSGTGYARIVMGASGVVLFLFLNNAVFRGAGDAAVAMRVLWVANIITLILDPCLIFGLGPFPRLGLAGAAVATTTGRGVGVLYQFYLLFRGTERIRVRPEHLRVRIRIMFRLVRVSLTGILQFVIAHTSWIGLVRIVSLFGSSPLAGYTIAVRIMMFLILPSWGLSNAAATLVGQNLGARLPERAEQSVWRTGIYNAVYMGAVGTFFLIFAEPAIRIFTRDPELVTLGAASLRIFNYGNIAYAYGMVLMQAFNGAGDTVTPTVLNALAFWFCELPLAYLLAVTRGFGPNGVYVSVPIAEGLLAIASVLVFRRGRWKLQRI